MSDPAARLRDLVVRTERPSDLQAILSVTEKAFGGPVEAELVRLIHDSLNFVPELSLVAENDGAIIGHVMLSYVELAAADSVHRVLTLSPVSVVPAEQRKGAGSALIKSALHRAGEHGEPMVILEGSPNYYGRLGFKDARDFGVFFDLPEWAPPNAGQMYKLANYDPAIKGKVRYPPAFAAAESLRPQMAEEGGDAR